MSQLESAIVEALMTGLVIGTIFFGPYIVWRIRNYFVDRRRRKDADYYY